MAKPKVFLSGGDSQGWAIDEDLKLTRQALEDVVTFTDLKQCDVVHLAWWRKLRELPEDLLIGRRVLCHNQNHPFRYMEQIGFRRTLDMVGCTIVRARQSQKRLKSIGIKSEYIPYSVDSKIFRPLSSNDTDLCEIQDKWHIPKDRYLIGNFHRDTEGTDAALPKIQKGPDVFAEIVHALVNQSAPIHVLLAGPRRSWLRKRLKELGVPFTFVGDASQVGDSLNRNILPRSTLNLLYNLLDLCLVSSRWEEGPHSIMEAAASHCKVISTKVGLAPDILRPECIFSSPVEGVEIIARDIKDNHLKQTLQLHAQKIVDNHRPETVAPLFKRLYERIDDVPPYSPDPSKHSTSLNRSKLQFAYKQVLHSTRLSKSQLLRGLLHKFLRPFLRKISHGLQSVRLALSHSTQPMTVGVWHRFHKPPYGGGNQFMLALCKELSKHDIQVVENYLGQTIDLYLLNSIHFDVMDFQKARLQAPLKVVHRVDGPISLYRGTGTELDDLCFELNHQFAGATVLQSAWTYQMVVEMGFHPVDPVIIHNAADPEIFHSEGRVSPDPNRKTRLISTSWSANPRKGIDVHKWLDANLDWSRFEYTFVGNSSEPFENIRQILPVSSQELAQILRQHDIYVAASQNDPCSNALVEALSCGLPALYLNDGGHPELVGFGGLPFSTVDEIPAQLKILAENLAMFQNLIAAPRLTDVASRYRELLWHVSRSPADVIP